MQAVHDLVSSRFLSTRGGTIAVGAMAALLAGVVLLVYLNRYRNSVDAAGQPVPVLVAKTLIEKGTTGEGLSAQKLFQVREVPRDQLQEGALTDPAALRGRVAVNDVLPGQQITIADFSDGASDAIGAKLVAGQRAIAVPVDSAHGLLGQVEAGDRVDVYGAFTVQRNATAQEFVALLAEDVPVLHAPEVDATKAVGPARRVGSVVLRVPSLASAKLAFAVEFGAVWFVLHPRSGAKPTPPSLTTVRQLLFGVKPLNVAP